MLKPALKLFDWQRSTRCLTVSTWEERKAGFVGWQPGPFVMEIYSGHLLEKKTIAGSALFTGKNRKRR